MKESSHGTGPSGNRLKQQAELFRALARKSWEEVYESELPRWRQLLYLLLLFGMLSAVLLLLISTNTRRRLIVSVGEGWVELFDQQSGTIFRLPPPPPNPVEPKFIEPTFTVRTSDTAEESSASLFGGAETSGAALSGLSTAPITPAKTSANLDAYKLLQEKSEILAQLVEGGFADLDFRDWSPVRNRPPEFWIDLLAARNGEEVHLVFSINKETGRVVALSQAARDLQEAGQ